MKTLSDERRQAIRADALGQKELLKQYGTISGANIHYLIKFILELTDPSIAALLAEKDKEIVDLNLELAKLRISEVESWDRVKEMKRIKPLGNQEELWKIAFQLIREGNKV